MREVCIRALVPSGADDAYRLLCNFDAYPEYTPSVRVTVSDRSAEGCLSEWDVDFRGGTLKWTERDRFAPAERSIKFEQVSGDLATFRGSWQVAPAEQGGSDIIFQCAFDLGIPSLSAFLEPVAEDALVENVGQILKGLFGSASQIQIDGARQR